MAVDATKHLLMYRAGPPTKDYSAPVLVMWRLTVTIPRLTVTIPRLTVTIPAPSYFHSAESNPLREELHGPKHEGAAKSLETPKLNANVILVYNVRFLERRIQEQAS